MKKIFGIIGIVLILMGSIFVPPVLGISTEEDLEIDLKILAVIGGTINVCNDENELYGFATIGYTNGEILTFERYTIKIEGFPFFIHKGLPFSLCIYRSIDV